MQEDIFILIESYRRDLTDVEQVIADYFLSKKAPIRIDQLAKKQAVSKASITRFCKKIGLNNYKELIFLYKLSLEKENNQQSVASLVTSVYHSLATRSDSTYSEKMLTLFVPTSINIKLFIFLAKDSIPMQVWIFNLSFLGLENTCESSRMAIPLLFQQILQGQMN